jgi:hypothetical protein
MRGADRGPSMERELGSHTADYGTWIALVAADTCGANPLRHQRYQGQSPTRWSRPLPHTRPDAAGTEAERSQHTALACTRPRMPAER